MCSARSAEQRAALRMCAVAVMAVLGAGPVAGAALLDIRIDFNQAHADPVTNWNIFNTQPSSEALIDYNTAATTGAQVTVTGFDDASGQNNQWQDTNAGPDWLDAQKNAAKDYFWSYESVSSTGTVLISGLGDANPYNIELVASRSASAGNNTATYTLNGAFFDGSTDGRFNAQDDGYGAGQWMTWSNVMPVDGEFVLTITHESGDDRSRLNALRVQEIPEPASLALIGIGGLVLLRRGARCAA